MFINYDYILKLKRKSLATMKYSRCLADSLTLYYFLHVVHAKAKAEEKNYYHFQAIHSYTQFHHLSHLILITIAAQLNPDSEL